MHISKRATKTLGIQCPMNVAFREVLTKFQDPSYKADEFLNLGVAHNDLLQEEIFQKTQLCLEVQLDDINYSAPNGSALLQIQLVNFFNRHFKPHYPLNPQHISVQTGAGASIHQLMLAIADPEDYCMIPAPYYGMFDLDVTVQTGVNILQCFPHSTTDMTIDGDILESTFQKATNNGKHVTSILITNPDNPLGRCYSRKDIETFILFASNHDLHIIFDEIYALSGFSHLLFKEEVGEDPFISVLSLNYKDFIDPSLVHVVYGMSKDFAVNGYRIGFIVDQFNELLRATLSRSAVFSYINTITDRLILNIFSDEEWIDKFLVSNRQALANSYAKTVDFLKQNKINYISAQAGPFFLLDFTDKIKTPEQEEQFFKQMVANGVYLAPGLAFYIQEPGYFRLTFALPWSVMQVGLSRILLTIASTLLDT